ncbi:hypothetical protein ABZ499_09770 [Streptomyces sp. NPDC019990]|uniref:hypothetical protein n=1 Tax=Streptomyces sp. NPDC019990 TaxID=3154693 RepID=UPI0033D6E528
MLVAAFSAVVALGALSGFSEVKEEVRANSSWPSVAVNTTYGASNSSWPSVAGNTVYGPTNSSWPSSGADGSGS